MSEENLINTIESFIVKRDDRISELEALVKMMAEALNRVITNYPDSYVMDELAHKALEAYRKQKGE